jgi:two-component system sensor histidine kinase YesM
LKAIEYGNNDISTMVMAISNLLRSSISKDDVITVEEDLKLVVDYIAVQQIRFEERLEFSMEPDPLLFNCKIPKMTLQPIVENSIRHNLEKHSEVCKINVSFTKHENYFSILVQDNGRDVNIDRIINVVQGLEKPSGTGLGLNNIHERIGICFGNEYGIKIYPGPESGLCVEITLPYKK